MQRDLIGPSGGADELREPAGELRKLFRAAGKPEPEIVVPLRATADDIAGLKGRIDAFADIGATRIAINAPYGSADEFRAADWVARRTFLSQRQLVGRAPHGKSRFKFYRDTEIA